VDVLVTENGKEVWRQPTRLSNSAVSAGCRAGGTCSPTGSGQARHVRPRSAFGPIISRRPARLKKSASAGCGLAVAVALGRLICCRARSHSPNWRIRRRSLWHEKCASRTTRWGGAQCVTVNKAEQHESARQVLLRTGLAETPDKRPHELSSATRQRVVVARALANAPEGAC
jgi:ABC-type sugar transport system ATPase subunit